MRKLSKRITATALALGMTLAVSAQSAFGLTFPWEYKTMKFNISGIETKAEVYNYDPDVKKDVVVFQHGAGERNNIFHDMIEEMKDEYTIVNIELLDDEFKAMGVEPNMDNYAEPLEEYITQITERFEVPKVHYVGHSLGSLLGFKMGDRGFDKIKSFTSIAGAPDTSYITNEYVDELGSSKINAMKLIYSETCEDFKTTINFFNWFNNNTLIYDFRYAVGYKVSGINPFPTLIVHGTKDTIVPVTQVDNLPYEKLYFPTGHLLLIEDDYVPQIVSGMERFIEQNN